MSASNSFSIGIDGRSAILTEALAGCLIFLSFAGPFIFLSFWGFGFDVLAWPLKPRNLNGDFSIVFHEAESGTYIRVVVNTYRKTRGNHE